MYNGCGCGCGSPTTCNPPVGLTPCANPYYPCTASSVDNLLGVDDNGNPRALEGIGIAVSDGDTAYITDGSAEKGLIPLDPDSVNGVDELLAVVNGKMYSIGYGAPEGSTLIKKGGQWVITSLSDRNSLFDPNKLRTGVKTLAGFSCSGNNGVVELGTVTPVPGGTVSWDDNGDLDILTPAEQAQNLLVPLCTETPAITSTETATAYLVCTENGVRKSAQRLGSPIYWMDPKVLIYSQIRYSLVTPLDNVYAIPAVPNATNGPITSETKDIDLTTMAGYTVNATAVILDCILAVYSGSTQTFNVVIVIDGLERLRVAGAPATGAGSVMETQVWVPIPPNKTLRVELVKQQIVAGQPVETITAVVRLTAFVSF